MELGLKDKRVVITGATQGIGRGMPASVLTLARSMFILLPLVLILPRFFDETGLWVSYPITDALSMIISVGWMVKEFRKQGIVYRWWGKDSPDDTQLENS